MQNLYKEYTKKHTKQSTLIIDSDNVKKLFSDFDPKAPEKVHEISSKVTQRFFETSLKDPKIKTVTFTMGGGGSGKSELIVQGAIERGDGLVLDGTGKNYKKLVANIEQAKKAGKKVKIEAVFIDFDKASAFNKKRDRTVPESILRETHKG